MTPPAIRVLHRRLALLRGEFGGSRVDDEGSVEGIRHHRSLATGTALRQEEQRMRDPAP